ncbi:hypothetical protein NPIL_105951, partial [Nephila pilipes]
MKLLCIVLLAGFIGVVSCDMKCMQMKVSECILILAIRYGENPVC